MAVGYSNDENYLGSDSYALKSMTNKISYLDDGELCVLSSRSINFYDANKKRLIKKFILFLKMKIFLKKEITKTLCPKKYLNNR